MVIELACYDQLYCNLHLRVKCFFQDRNRGGSVAVGSGFVGGICEECDLNHTIFLKLCL